MFGLACLSIGAASWFFCLSVPRSTSAWRGYPGAIAGLLLCALGVFALIRSGVGTAEALSIGLGLLMFALPCTGWLRASLSRTRHPRSPT